MKKSLIFTAVLATLGTSAFAQSSVSIYGVVDAGISRADNGVSITNGVVSGGQSASRLGFKGTEDLGGGSSVSFVLESGISIDTGAITQANTTFGRQAWVGFNNDKLGSVKLGLQYAPIRSALEVIDPFSVSSSGNSLKTLGDGAYVERLTNSVSYSTPSISGFSGQVAYGFGETAGNSSANRNAGLGVNYDNGPLAVRFAHNNRNINAVGVDSQARESLIGATYNFGMVKGHAAYAQRNLENNLTATERKSSNYLLGVTVPFGPHSVMASYIHNEVRNTSNSDSNQVSLGYAYELSKRTNLYTNYARYTNDSAVALNVAANGLTGSQFNAGIRHKF